MLLQRGWVVITAVHQFVPYKKAIISTPSETNVISALLDTVKSSPKTNAAGICDGVGVGVKVSKVSGVTVVVTVGVTSTGMRWSERWRKASVKRLGVTVIVLGVFGGVAVGVADFVFSGVTVIDGVIEGVNEIVGVTVLVLVSFSLAFESESMRYVWRSRRSNRWSSGTCSTVGVKKLLD